ncbi:MAG: hypothetical protein AAGI30_07020 [Planctomycetota bacterium]
MTHRRGGALAGCLIAAGVVAVLVIIGVVLLVMNLKTLAVDGAAGFTKAAVSAMPLPEQEKPEINAIIDRLATSVKDGDITIEEATRLLQGLENSPFLAMGGVSVFEATYLSDSGLSDEEKAEASLTLNRVAQGVVAKTITTSDIDGLLGPVRRTTPDGSTEFKPPSEVSDDDLRQVVADAKALADDRDVSMERVEVDLSDSLEQAIEEMLGRELPG